MVDRLHMQKMLHSHCTFMPLLRLFCNHEIHRCKQFSLTTCNKAVGGQRQTVGSLLCASGEELEGFHETDETMNETTAPPRHPGDGEEVPRRGHVLERTSKRVVPGDRIRAISQVLVVEEIKASVLDGSQALGHLDHVGDTVSLLNTKTDCAVLRVVVVVLVGHEPFVDTENTTRLEHTLDFLVDTDELGRVDSGLDGVDSVEGVVGELHLHEVTLDEAQLVAQALALRITGGTLDLVVVVVEPNHVSISELGDLTGRAANTAANIKHLHAGLDTHLVGEVVFVAGDCLVEGLSVGKATEVEGCTPSVLVKIGSKVVVAVPC